MDIETYALLMRHIKQAETGVSSASIDENGHLIITTYGGDAMDAGKVVEDIDDELSETSENAVQNKVVTAQFKSKGQDISALRSDTDALRQDTDALKEDTQALKYTVITEQEIDNLFN